MPAMRDVPTDSLGTSWLATRRVEGFWDSDGSESYPTPSVHAEPWRGSEAWVERLRIIEWRLWLGEREREEISENFMAAGWAVDSCEAAALCFHQRGLEQRACDMCEDAKRSRATDAVVGDCAAAAMGSCE